MWKEPSPAQSQHAIVLATDKDITIGEITEFRHASDGTAPNIRVEISEIKGNHFAGRMPQGHYAAGTLPNSERPGVITISYAT